MYKRLFVLGAQDPEMREIERVLKLTGAKYGYAAVGTFRSSPQTAYTAETVILEEQGRRPLQLVVPPSYDIIAVECTLVSAQQPALRIDHHNPGDPGYTAGPENYLQGSSLGQLLSILGLEPTETQKLLAASDHCLTAAYQGLCPGVDPDELLFLRASWQAKITNKPLGEVIQGILSAAKAVERCYDPELKESRFLDPTRAPDKLAEGGAYTGKPIRYRGLSVDGQLKEMLKGGAPEQIEAFILEHRRNGRQAYGNPYRGYAGAYL